MTKLSDCCNKPAYHHESFKTLWKCSECWKLCDVHNAPKPNKHLEQGVELYVCSCSYMYDPELSECPACGEKKLKEKFYTKGVKLNKKGNWTKITKDEPIYAGWYCQKCEFVCYNASQKDIDEHNKEHSLSPSDPVEEKFNDWLIKNTGHDYKFWTTPSVDHKDDMNKDWKKRFDEKFSTNIDTKNESLFHQLWAYDQVKTFIQSQIDEAIDKTNKRWREKLVDLHKLITPAGFETPEMSFNQLNDIEDGLSDLLQGKDSV